jgi:hypothetical protein
MFRLYPLGCLYPNANRRGTILQAPVTRGKAVTAARKTAFCRAARMGSGSGFDVHELGAGVASFNPATMNTIFAPLPTSRSIITIIGPGSR